MSLPPCVGKSWGHRASDGSGAKWSLTACCSQSSGSSAAQHHPGSAILRSLPCPRKIQESRASGPQTRAGSSLEPSGPATLLGCVPHLCLTG